MRDVRGWCLEHCSSGVGPMRCAELATHAVSSRPTGTHLVTEAPPVDILLMELGPLP